ncbi:hypothetical protein BKA70DRAFT_1113583, partial [Coprinopsis sp. MPI-PUGE-AT-0042]
AISLRVTDVTVHEFENLLGIWFPNEYGVREDSIDVWFDVLKLSTKWGFSRLMTHALSEVQRLEATVSPNLSLIDRILLYEQHQAPAFYIAGLLAQLCHRDIPLTSEDEEKLGWQRCCKLWRVIYGIRTEGGRSPAPKASLEETRDLVSKELGLSLDMIVPATTNGEVRSTFLQ